MKKFKAVGARIVLGLALALAVSPLASAETFKKLHSEIQRIINITSTAGMNDANETTSSTVNLSGGDLDKASFTISFSSGVGIGTATLAVQTSPDGGTTWATTYNIPISTSAAATAGATTYVNIPVTGNRLRVVPALTANTTFYGFKVWVVPSVD
jgi:hypothetical protein